MKKGRTMFLLWRTHQFFRGTQAVEVGQSRALARRRGAERPLEDSLARPAGHRGPERRLGAEQHVRPHHCISLSLRQSVTKKRV